MDKELKVYAELLQRYITTLDERFLYRAEQISNVFIKNDILPAELIKIHMEAMEQEQIKLSDEATYAMDFLLEAMIASNKKSIAYVASSLNLICSCSIASM